MNRQRIGLVGLGAMGQAFIKNLHLAGYQVQGFDISTERLEQLAAAGGITVESPAQAVNGVDHVILSLPTSGIAREVIFGANGIAEGAKEGLYICDTTTARPEDSETIHNDLKERGIRYLDSAASGTSTMAEAKDLVLIVGGEEADFKACRPIFDGFSRAAYHMGPSGAGARTKLIINLVLAGNRLALAEGLVMADKVGLEQMNMLKVLQDGASSSKTMTDKGPKMINADYTAEGQVQISLKDSRLMMEMGQKVGAPTMMIQVYSQLMQAALEKGYGPKDTVAFFEIIRGLAGLEERHGNNPG